MFDILQGEHNNVKRFKREANIKLASLLKDNVDKDVYSIEKSVLEKSLDIIYEVTMLDEHEGISQDSVFDRIAKFDTTGLLSPLTLKDDEFSKPMETLDRYNLRDISICKDDKGIYYERAFIIKPIRQYHVESNKEVIVDGIPSTGKMKLYLTAGGVMTGEYFDKCYLHEATINRGIYNPKHPIQIPVSVIDVNGLEGVHVLDKREPKLKALMSFYNVEIKMDESKKSLYDIRKFIKLNNK